MAYLNNKIDYRVQLMSIFLLFFAYGYPTPLDTIKKQNCHNGYLLQINGRYQCIDTTIIYYPREIDDIIEGHGRRMSLNLQLLEESRWDHEDIQEDRLRVILFEYGPSYDSIVLYSFFKRDRNNIKLIKKEMPAFYQPGDFLDSSPPFNNIEEVNIVNYKQTEIIIPKKKMPKFIKQLNKSKKSETFDGYEWPPIIVVEYFYKGDYYQSIIYSHWAWPQLPIRMFSK
jgi:hypothetical protein